MINFPPVKTPYLLKLIYSNLTWRIKTEKKEIFLTFDDGPTLEITSWVLLELKKYNAKATFFCIGSNIEKHPEIFKKIISEGHSIGNHTLNHVNGWKTSKNKYLHEIRLTECIINKYISYNNSKLFRPPFGKITKTQAKTLLKKNYTIVMWDILAKDWMSNINPKRIKDIILKGGCKGSILVFHDSLKAEKNLKEILPEVLKYFSEIGY
jgi:peptidoglycan-N-acetylglucosamine deacetylase